MKTSPRNENLLGVPNNSVIFCKYFFLWQYFSHRVLLNKAKINSHVILCISMFAYKAD